MNNAPERFDVYDLDGKKTGRVATLDEIVAEELPIMTVAAWLVNRRGQILVHKDGKHEYNTFGEWRISIAGKVKAGEDSVAAVRREALEELGLDISKDRFQFIKTVFYNGPRYPAFFSDIYVVFTDTEISEMTPDAEEIAGLKWFGRDKLLNQIKDGLNVSRNFESRLYLLFEFLDKKS
ncbi:MAG: NUDIX domain-containing protein [Alphaproteobacteria bacterium]|nr:NUDIX domain-containing protein [Alphaproteobacteria bacterium]MCL2757746.1 NUDIX domain-containing protein [Alphaproteobacteria bacterium]